MKHKDEVGFEDPVLEIKPSYEENLLNYYEEAGLDYGVWSEEFHMHFGFWRKGINPFKRERMLEETNEQVFESLKVEEGGRYLDAGCGVGATARQFTKKFLKSKLDAISLVPKQIERAKEMSDESESLEYYVDNFEGSRMQSGVYDGAYALESSCHGHGEGKKAFSLEMARLLKSGGRLVVFDLMEHGGRMNGFVSKLYKRMCQCWAVDRFARKDEFLKCLEKAGFELVEEKDVSWSMVPSVLHIPVVVLKFLGIEWKSLHKLDEQRKNNVLGPIYGFFFGLIGRRYVGYYKLILRKR